MSDGLGDIIIIIITVDSQRRQKKEKSFGFYLLMKRGGKNSRNVSLEPSLGLQVFMKF